MAVFVGAGVLSLVSVVVVVPLLNALFPAWSTDRVLVVSGIAVVAVAGLMGLLITRISVRHHRRNDRNR